MRAICNPCPHKDTCSYLKQGKESDCIDVQASDYGYEEAVEKACARYEQELKQFKNLLGFVKRGSGDVIDIEKSIESFRKALEL